MPLIVVCFSVSEMHERVFILSYATHTNEERGDYKLGHIKGKIRKKIPISNMKLVSSLFI